MKGLLIDVRYCTGCHSCEMACKAEHQFENKDQCGIKVFQNGPVRIDEHRWQFDFVPVPTSMCDLCAARSEKGKEPSCVVHCQSFALECGEVEELSKRLADGGKIMLYSIDPKQ